MRQRLAPWRSHDGAAPRFGGTPDFLGAFKLAAYGITAAWLANLFSAVPTLGGFGIVGLYSVHLLFAGLPVLMRAPPLQVPIYAIAVMPVSVLLDFVTGSILALLFATPFFPG